MIKTINAQEKETFLFLAEDAAYAEGAQTIFKASDFLMAVPVNSTRTIFRFRPQDKTALGIGGDPAPDTFTLIHTEDAHIEVMKKVGEAMDNSKGGMVVVHDDGGITLSSDGSQLFGSSPDFSEIKWGKIESTGTVIEVTDCIVVATEA